MSGEVAVQVEGRIGSDPDLKFLDSGTAVAKFSLATSNRVKQKDGNWADGETIWFRCEVWNKRGEAVTEYLHKGDLVNVAGGMFQSSWTNKNGEEVKDLVIRVESIGKIPTMKMGTSVHTDSADPWA
jgi:single-strand DNA-binding protein